MLSGRKRALGSPAMIEGSRPAQAILGPALTRHRIQYIPFRIDIRTYENLPLRRHWLERFRMSNCDEAARPQAQYIYSVLLLRCLPLPPAACITAAPVELQGCCGCVICAIPVGAWLYGAGSECALAGCMMRPLHHHQTRSPRHPSTHAAAPALCSKKSRDSPCASTYEGVEQFQTAPRPASSLPFPRVCLLFNPRRGPD
jgi:hypothetical protein